MDKFERVMGKLCVWLMPLLCIIGFCAFGTERLVGITLISITAIYYTALIIDKLWRNK